MQNDSTNEAKHTPGPWSFEFSDYGGYDCMWSVHRVTAASGEEVAQIHTLQRSAKATHEEPHAECPTQLANARLIAAAPELLESLIDALGWLESAIDCEADLSGIEDAITKATGRATP